MLHLGGEIECELVKDSLSDGWEVAVAEHFAALEDHFALPPPVLI